MRYCIRAVVAASIILPLAAQFTERIDVRVHELEVVVDTRDGKPVTNLTKDDFIVLQDGVQQTITNFAVINESEGSAAVTADATQANAPAPAAQPVVQRKPRKFVFFIDAFEMHDGTRNDLLKQCSDLMGTMEPGDEAMVVTPALTTRIPLFFTNDKDAVMKTLDRITAYMMRMGDAAVRGDCGQSSYACATNRIENLRSVVRALSDVPGRKIVVLMTTVMTSTPGLSLGVPGDRSVGGLVADPRMRTPIISDDARDVRRLVEETARLAAASNVTIYGLEAYEPGYSALPGVTSDIGTTNLSGANLGDRSNSALKPSAKRGQEGTQDLLITLAERTGAKNFSGTNDSVKMFEQISQDTGTYYSIGYRDTDNKTKDHKVEVRIRNRNDLVVRTRQSVRSRSREDEQKGLAMAAVLSSKTYNNLRIRLTASPLQRKGRIVEIPVHVHIPMSRLLFLDEGGQRRAKFQVVVAAVGENGDFGESQTEHVQDIVVPDARWEEAKAEEFAYDTAVRVNPGKYRIAVGVSDANSGEAGFQTFSVNAQ